jgi:GNAT superfamily N-acetyltransferase
MSMPLGHVFVAGGAEGVAAWAPPGRWGEGRLRQLWELPGFLRAIGIGRIPEVVPAVMALEASHPRRPHYYLFEIAVDPPSQGQGIGGALLRHVLDECDRRGLPAYLESSNPRNNPLYEHHGFRVTGRHMIGRNGPPVWLMWRDPT